MQCSIAYGIDRHLNIHLLLLFRLTVKRLCFALYRFQIALVAQAQPVANAFDHVRLRMAGKLQGVCQAAVGEPSRLLRLLLTDLKLCL